MSIKLFLTIEPLAKFPTFGEGHLLVVKKLPLIMLSITSFRDRFVGISPTRQTSIDVTAFRPTTYFEKQ